MIKFQGAYGNLLFVKQILPELYMQQIFNSLDIPATIFHTICWQSEIALGNSHRRATR